MSFLLDKLLTREQLAQCRHFDSAQWPPRRVDCVEEGAQPYVPYSIGRIQAESKQEARGFWWAMPAVAVLSILAAWVQFGSPV